jgi:hypothetical protein
VLTGNLNRASAGDTLLADHDVNLAASDEPALIAVARMANPRIPPGQARP